MGILRLFLATVVLLFHTPEGVISKFLHPALAVQCFYVISGFYVQLLIHQFQKTEGNWKLAFYKSRFLRIFPTYYVFLIATLIVTGALVNHYNADTPQYFLLFLLNNMFIFSQDILRFLHLGGFTLLGQSWTLAIELMFYCLAPFLLTKRNSLVVLVIVASICCRLILNAYGFNKHGWLYGFFPSELGIFLLGSLSFRFYAHFLHNRNEEDTKLLKYIGFSALVYLLYFDYIGRFKIPGGNWDSPVAAGVPLSYWAVILLTIVSLPFIFKMSKNSKIDRFIGELSYPLYMGHLFVLLLIKDSVPEKFQNLVTLIITFLISCVIVRFIEAPLARYRVALKDAKKITNDASDIAIHKQKVLQATC